MEDLLKNLRALARGKHDDFSVVFEACLEISRLRGALRNVYEVWAGSEGTPMPKTETEQYLVDLIENMIDEAKEGMKRMEEEIGSTYCDSHCVWTDHDKDCPIGKRHA